MIATDATTASLRPPPLDPARIVTAAWALVARDGFDQLSTRRLAIDLGVQGPALYHHVASMAELQGLMIEAILREAMVEPAPGQPWQDWFRALALRHWEVLLAHRDSGRIAAASTPSRAMASEVVPMLSRPLEAAGFPAGIARAATSALAGLLLGSVLNQQHEGHRSLAEAVMPVGQAFAFGVEAIIGELERRR